MMEFIWDKNLTDLRKSVNAWLIEHKIGNPKIMQIMFIENEEYLYYAIADCSCPICISLAMRDTSELMREK